MNIDERLELFLKELKVLRDKYNFELYGCGCCDCVIDVKTNDNIVRKLDFDQDKDEYWIEKSY